LADKFVAHIAGGISVTLVGHPFDTVKVRLQTQPANNPIYSKCHARGYSHPNVSCLIMEHLGKAFNGGYYCRWRGGLCKENDPMGGCSRIIQGELLDLIPPRVISPLEVSCFGVLVR
jgi:Mitochondrial carrier protein